MSEATSLADGPSYSLFFEIAVAVGTTVLAMFLCQNRRRNAALASTESANLKMTTDRKQKETDYTKTRKPTDTAARQQPHVDEKIHQLDSKTTKPNNKTFASATTQTEIPSMDERITWKAIVVNPWENSVRRYRSELYVDVNGVVTRSESFQNEGVVGVGIKQILAKVQ